MTFRNPSFQPSIFPSTQPSAQPTRRPSSRPSQPTCLPSSQPTRKPVRYPTQQPQRRPTKQPSSQPVKCPSSQPSHLPTQQPSAQPRRFLLRYCSISFLRFSCNWIECRRGDQVVSQLCVPLHNRRTSQLVSPLLQLISLRANRQESQFIFLPLSRLFTLDHFRPQSLMIIQADSRHRNRRHRRQDTPPHLQICRASSQHLNRSIILLVSLSAIRHLDLLTHLWIDPVCNPLDFLLDSQLYNLKIIQQVNHLKFPPVYQRANPYHDRPGNLSLDLLSSQSPNRVDDQPFNRLDGLVENQLVNQCRVLQENPRYNHFVSLHSNLQWNRVTCLHCNRFDDPLPNPHCNRIIRLLRNLILRHRSVQTWFPPRNQRDK